MRYIMLACSFRYVHLVISKILYEIEKTGNTEMVGIEKPTTLSAVGFRQILYVTSGSYYS